MSIRPELVAQLTAPGQEFEIVARMVRGAPQRVYLNGPQTLRDVALASAEFGDRTFLVYRDERWTYARHASVVAGLARSLREEYGLAKGDRLAVAMRNYPEWAQIFFAAQVIGVVVVPLNTWWTAAELRYAISDATPKLLVADAECAALLAGDRLGGVPVIEARGHGRSGSATRSWDDWVASLDTASAPPDAVVDPDDDATILYTSGTTGKPKGAVGTHRNHCTNLRNTLLNTLVGAVIANGGQPPQPDPDAAQPSTLCTFPWFHIGGLTVLTFGALVGAKLVTQYKWDRAEARELIKRERLTAVAGVPTVIRQVIEDAATYPDELAPLAGMATGATPVPPDLIRRTADFDPPISAANGYGLTETTSAVVTNSGEDYVARPDSVGRCQPGTDIRVVDPVSGEDVPAGEVGELWFRGPNIVRGYWNNAEATAAAFTDGWFHSGDLGRVVDDWVYVVDRLKDVVIRGGENIYCVEVESALLEHPAIEDAAVVGVPHDTLGEEAVAFVVPRRGAEITEAAVRRHAAERLAYFKVPAQVVIRPEPLPRTATGKVLKRDLRSAIAGKVGG